MKGVGNFSPTDEFSVATSFNATGGVANAQTGGSEKQQPARETIKQLSQSSSIPDPTPTSTSGLPLHCGNNIIERSPSAVSDMSKTGSDMVVSYRKGKFLHI